MKKKVKQTYSNFKEYWQNLKPYIKVLYILAWVLFIAEMIYAVHEGNEWHYIIYKFKYPEHAPWNFDFEELYSLFLPLIYTVINCLLVKFKKINLISLFILLVLRLSSPDIFNTIMCWIFKILYEGF